MTVDHPEAAGFDLSSLETLVYGMTKMAPIMTTLADVFHRGEGLARGKVGSPGQASFVSLAAFAGLIGVGFGVGNDHARPLLPPDQQGTATGPSWRAGLVGCCYWPV